MGKKQEDTFRVALSNVGGMGQTGNEPQNDDIRQFINEKQID